MGFSVWKRDFKLALEPADKIVFTGKELGEEPISIALKVTNPLKEPVAYKVKCTSNEMFKIRPPVGSLKPNESVSVNLTFNADKTVPENGKHYFVIYFINAADGMKPRSAAGDHATAKNRRCQQKYRVGDETAHSGGSYRDYVAKLVRAILRVDAAIKNSLRRSRVPKVTQTSARDCWSEHKGMPDGVKQLYVDFVKEEAEDLKDEKKGYKME